LGGPRGRLISTSDRRMAVQLISEANSAVARLELACRELGISVRTYQRWMKGGGVDSFDKRPTAKRRPPSNKLSKEEKTEILEVCNSATFADLTPAQIVPKLADQGIYIASESTFYKVLKEANQSIKRTRVNPPRTSSLTTHIATGPNQVWSWDITWLPAFIKGAYYKLYMVIDVFSRLIINWEIHEVESSKHAQDLIKKAVFKHKVFQEPLVLHSDNGSPMKAQDFQNLLVQLGVTKSYSRPRVSNDNPFSESLFKTLKYTKDFPLEGFGSIDEARTWVRNFVELYNTEFLHSGIKFVTPLQRHTGKDVEILAKRDEVYKEAKQKRPERWSTGTRDWSRIDQVALNPTDELRSADEKKKRQLP